MSKVLKTSTKITGLAVATNPHHTLSSLYGKIQRALAKMPACTYRNNTEKIVAERAAIVSTTPSVPDIEKKIGCGQVEELIVQAENELILARKMLGWKPWEQLVATPPKTQWQWPPAQISPQN